eukprot:7685591-Alexandrium_andersonii.AAC.1
MVDTLEKLAKDLLLKLADLLAANGELNSRAYPNKPKVPMPDQIYCGSDPQHALKVLEPREIDNCRPVVAPGLDSWGVSDGDGLEFGIQQAGLYE